jgi:hypothetical protein
MLRCPICIAAGLRSVVRDIRFTNPKLKRDHFWDEEGVEHFHDPSVIVTEYECSNGHHFAERSSWQCHVCGYRACEAVLLVDGKEVVTDPSAAESPCPPQ